MPGQACQDIVDITCQAELVEAPVACKWASAEQAQHSMLQVLLRTVRGVSSNSLRNICSWRTLITKSGRLNW